MKQRDTMLGFTKSLITLYIICMFSLVWVYFYNNFAFHANRELGAIISITIYIIIYQNFARLYRAFKIVSYHIGEVVFSQFLALGLSNAILYIECCLVANRYVSVFPIVLLFIVQFVGAMIWAVIAKQTTFWNLKPSHTLLIYGEKNCFEFVTEMRKKYSHLFLFDEIISYREFPVEQLRKKIDSYDCVVLYEINGGMRTPLMEYCIYKNKPFYVTPRIADIIIEGFGKRHLIDTPILKYEYNYLSTQKQFTKRVFDLIISGAALLLAVIPMLFVAIAIKLEDGGPVLFKQKRCTKDEKEFYIYKFRSMIVDAEKEGRAIPCKANDDRITRVGRFIRRVRLDELPQIFNILKGEMSVVGPRPERVEHVKAYTEGLPEFTYRARVKAGLTGYAQIYGKYNTSPYEKLKLDLMYIENQSLILDLKILLLTIKTIFIPESTEGFDEEKSKLMEKRLTGIYEK